MTNPVEHLKPLLDDSIKHLDPALEQQLNSRRQLAMGGRRDYLFRFSYGLVPLALVAGLWLMQATAEPDIEQQALYDDLDLLIEQDELTFLEDMDVSAWLVEAQQSSKDGA